MNRIWRNRAILAISVALVALALFAVQYEGIYDIKAAIRGPETPFDRLEESGFADILHFGRVESRWASNMIIHVAAILYPPWPDLSDAYVVIESDAYVVQRGGYVWDPEEREAPDVKWSHWTVPKYKHYNDGALFPPAKAEPALEAIKVLVDWQNTERMETQDRAMREWVYAVVEEALEYEDWTWIEIDLFNVVEYPRPTLIATEKGKPAWAAGYELQFTHTISIYRRNAEDSDWTVDKILEQGELTEEILLWMLETGQVQVEPAMTWFGPIPYSYEQYGFNHPWQGREIKR